MKNLNIIIITGLSGSGKSTAIAALEDAGFFCIDNMPVDLLPKFLKMPIESESEIAGIALVMDIREKSFLAKYPDIFASLKKKGYRFEVLFLEADEKILLQRYQTTRRQHPLSQGKNLLEGIRAEKELLKGLRAASHKIIDTSGLNVHELKAYILDTARKSKKLVPMSINVVSFGFKFGSPHDADLIIDVRFLANPYFVAELKLLSGEDQAIRDFVLRQEETQTFLAKYFDLLDYLIPLYEKEGKAYLTIAVGCTGGRHRSVTIARSIYNHVRKLREQVVLSHRDIDQPS